MTELMFSSEWPLSEVTLVDAFAVSGRFSLNGSTYQRSMGPFESGA